MDRGILEEILDNANKQTPNRENLLFDQNFHDKALLADKRVRKMFFESFKEEFVMAQKKTNFYDFHKWYQQKLKELE